MYRSLTRQPDLRVVLVMGLLLGLSLLLLSACGGGGTSGAGASGGGEHQQAKIRGCVPECLSGGADPGRIPPGSYTTQYFFDGHLTVTFRKAWVSHEDQPVEFSAKPEVKQDGEGEVKFWEDIIPVEGKTFDVKHRAKGVPITTAGWLHWLSNNPNLRVSDPKKATIGEDDLPAKVVDVGISDEAVNDEPGYAPCRKETCQTFLTWPNAGGNYFGLIDSEVIRLYLSDVKYGGKTHLFAIAIYAQDPAGLKAFAPAAEMVIDSVRAPVSPA
jgi:hypothetical protein